MIRILPKGRLARKEARWFYFFVAPWVIGFILFNGYNFVYSVCVEFGTIQGELSRLKSPLLDEPRVDDSATVGSP